MIELFYYENKNDYYDFAHIDFYLIANFYEICTILDRRN